MTHENILAVLDAVKKEYKDVSFIVEFCEFGADSYCYDIYHDNKNLDDDVDFYACIDSFVRDKFPDNYIDIGITYGLSYLPDLLIWDDHQFNCKNLVHFPSASLNKEAINLAFTAEPGNCLAA